MQQYKFTPDDLEDLGQVGVGNYGTVLKMSFKETGTEMAVKVHTPFPFSVCPFSLVLSTCSSALLSVLPFSLQKIPVPELRVNDKDNIVELSVVMGTGTCPDIVEYYGCLIREVSNKWGIPRGFPLDSLTADQQSS